MTLERTRLVITLWLSLFVICASTPSATAQQQGQLIFEFVFNRVFVTEFPGNISDYVDFQAFRDALPTDIPWGTLISCEG